MSNNKQTAVEWLVSVWAVQGTLYNSDIEQAKEIEKQQIIDAFGVGCQVESTRLIGYQDIADDYYNETFKPE